MLNKEYNPNLRIYPNTPNYSDGRNSDTLRPKVEGCAIRMLHFFWGGKAQKT